MAEQEKECYSDPSRASKHCVNILQLLVGPLSDIAMPVQDEGFIQHKFYGNGNYIEKSCLLQVCRELCTCG